MPAINDEHCGKCGYDLTGLSFVGQCPECGQVYDVLRRQGIRTDTSPLERGDRLAVRLRTLAWFAAAVMFLVGGGVLSLVVTNAQTAWYIGAMFAAICLLAAITSYLYENPDR